MSMCASRPPRGPDSSVPGLPGWWRSTVARATRRDQGQRRPQIGLRGAERGGGGEREEGSTFRNQKKGQEKNTTRNHGEGVGSPLVRRCRGGGDVNSPSRGIGPDGAGVWGSGRRSPSVPSPRLAAPTPRAPRSPGAYSRLSQFSIGLNFPFPLACFHDSRSEPPPRVPPNFLCHAPPYPFSNE